MRTSSPGAGPPSFPPPFPRGGAQGWGGLGGGASTPGSLGPFGGRGFSFLGGGGLWLDDRCRRCAFARGQHVQSRPLFGCSD